MSKKKIKIISVDDFTANTFGVKVGQIYSVESEGKEKPSMVI